MTVPVATTSKKPSPIPPRILHIITRLDAGGAATNTIISVDHLRAEGFNTHLAYGLTDDPHHRILDDLQHRALKVIHFPNLVREIAPLQDFITLLQLIKLIRKWKYNLIHTHSSKAGAIGRLAAFFCGIPAIHTPHGHIFYGYFKNIPTRIFVTIEKSLARLCIRIVSLTDVETRESLERAIGRPEQYITIPSGVPLGQFRQLPVALGQTFRKDYHIPEDAILVISVGRLVAIKGFDSLLQAIEDASAKSVFFFTAIIGDGEEREHLETLVKEKGIQDRVIFTGSLSDIRGAISAADIFALASRNEGMGRAFIEAMASGLPVVGTRVGGIPSFITDEISGLLVDSEDIPQLTSALSRLVENKELRRRLGKEAESRVYPDFDQQTMVHGLAGLYRQALDSG